MCVRVPASTAPLRQSRPNHRKGDNRSPAPRRLACLAPLQWTRHSLLRCPLLQSRPGTCLLRHMLCDRDVLPSAKPLKRIDLPMLHASASLQIAWTQVQSSPHCNGGLERRAVGVKGDQPTTGPVCNVRRCSRSRSDGAGFHAAAASDPARLCRR